MEMFWMLQNTAYVCNNDTMLDFSKALIAQTELSELITGSLRPKLVQ